MKYKIPVLISNCSALPEVNGDAALYFNPNNPSDISIKINKLINSQRLRKSLIHKGIKQVNKFKWINTYRNLMKIITKKI
jgi:glycosyltransferase involved in cell wall biosynthesis